MSNESDPIKIKFVDTVLDLTKRPGVTIEQSIEDAESIFTKAGLVLRSFTQDASYENRGLPPRGAIILLKEGWDERADEWTPAVSWKEASRIGRVTSRKPMYGRRGPNDDKLPCFNIRPAYKKNNNAFSYSPKRLYLNEEGITWRWSL